MGRPKGVEHWETEVAALELRAPRVRQVGSTVFLGSSTFRLWETMEADLAEFNVVNNGFGGARVNDLEYYADRLVKPWVPSMVVLYGGGNDVYRGAKGADVGEQYRRLIERVRVSVTGAHICVMTVLPHPAFEEVYEELEALNVASASLADSFIEAWQPLIKLGKYAMNELFLEDRIHLNKRGYEWLKQTTLTHLKEIA